MTRPVIWPSRVPIRVAAVPVLVGGVPLTGKTLCSICQAQSSPGSSADQLMLKVDEPVVEEDVWARAASMNRRTRARARVSDRQRMIMGSLGAGGWPRLAHDGANETDAKTKKPAAQSPSDFDSRDYGGLRPETWARRRTAHFRVAGERPTDSRECFFDRLLAALERLVEDVLAVLEAGEGFRGRADFLVEGFEAGEVDVGACTGCRDHSGSRLGIAGKRAGRFLIGRREAFVVREGDVELLAQILERAAWAHFGKDMLDAAIGAGGVADLHEDPGRLLPFQRLQRGKNSGPGLGGAFDLFRVASRLHAVGGEDAKLVAETAGRGGGLRLGVRRGRGCGSRAGGGGRLRRGGPWLRAAGVVGEGFGGEGVG